LKVEVKQWYHSSNHSDGINWEDPKKAFHLKYYSSYKVYCDRSHIYNFWSHPEESIAPAWRRLKGLLLKNPNKSRSAHVRYGTHFFTPNPHLQYIIGKIIEVHHPSASYGHIENSEI
jgi:hypothetical protein